jgi:hypothetical protein
MARKLALTVYVVDPDTGDAVRLDAGSKPHRKFAALVTNPAAWGKGGKDDDADDPEPSADEAG